jgi:hypothetical protein
MALYLLSLESLTAEGNASAPAPAGNLDAGANTAKPAHEQTAA